MSDLDGLLAAVLAEPECDVVRGAYADALEETQVPANVARAEFIRLQIEIPRLMAIVHRWVNTPSNKPGGTAKDGGPAGAAHGTACSLENRAEKLFEQYKCEWFGERVAIHYLGFESEDAEGQYPDLATTVVSRGFIHIVRGPLAVLRGGEPCPHCDRGVQWRSMPPDSRVCESCGGEPVLRKPGTGRTAGILRELVRREPVEVVEVVDKKPEQLGSGRFMWAHEGNLHNSDDPEEAKIPDALFWKMARMDGTHYTDDPDIRCRWLWIDTRELALAALSNALLAEAKGQVTA